MNPDFEGQSVLWINRPESESSSKKKMNPAMELLVKAGADGSSIGDCPFAQFVRIVLEIKGIEYTVSPHSKDTKPRWLLDGYDGKMPCLVHDGEAYTESDNIANYIRFFYPEPPLPRGSEEARVAVGDFFPTLASFLKNTDDDRDASLEASLVSSLSRIDAHLASQSADVLTNTPMFMDGPKMCLVDCSLAPKLHHMLIAADHFKNFEVPEEFAALRAYMDAIFSIEEVSSTCPSRDDVVWGWSSARNQAAD